MVRCESHGEEFENSSEVERIISRIAHYEVIGRKAPAPHEVARVERHILQLSVVHAVVRNGLAQVHTACSRLSQKRQNHHVPVMFGSGVPARKSVHTSGHQVAKYIDNVPAVGGSIG